MASNNSPTTDKPENGKSGQPASEEVAQPTHGRRSSSLDRTFNPAHEKARKAFASALELAVSNSDTPDGLELHGSSLGTHSAKTRSSLSHIFGEDVHKYFADDDMGNFVIVRKTGAKQWEKMPLYARIGMHLLFHGPAAIRFLTWGWIRKLLKEQSIREGKIYDNTDPKKVLSHIHSFIATYSIDTSELLEKDLKKYPTFNSFFSRKLKPNARPPASPNDPTIIGSAADSRSMVFHTVDAARKFWVKGKHFTIPLLLQDSHLVTEIGDQPSLAIFRLAPQDYHRFHSPVSGTVRKITHIPGEYYTVNPQAINEDLDVFTANTRSVAILDAKVSNDGDATVPVALVAVGALLVGSISFEKQAGDQVSRGEDFGYFSYGGSTVIVVLPKSLQVKFDEDLVRASDTPIEVLVRAGEKIGKVEKAAE